MQGDKRMGTLIDFRDKPDAWGGGLKGNKAKVLPDGSVDGTELLEAEEARLWDEVQDRFEKEFGK